MSGQGGKAAWIAAWTDDGYFRHPRARFRDAVIAMERVPAPEVGDEFSASASGSRGETGTDATLVASLEIDGKGSVAEISTRPRQPE